MGSHCLECLRAVAPSPVEKVRSRVATGAPVATAALVAANVVVYLWSQAAQSTRGLSSVIARFGLFGPIVAENGEWYRLITSGFLHFDLRHIGFNMVMLWLLGRQLERIIGPVRFLAVYAVALLGGSALALLLSPNAITAGASGAIFGVMSALYVAMERRGLDPWNSGVGSLILINVFLSFMIPNISIGGHLGGLVGGALAVYVLDDRGAETWRRRAVVRWGAAVGLGVLMFGAGLVAASTWSSPLL